MNELDVYYRALLNYRAETVKDRECTRFRRSISQTDADKDQIEIIRNVCTVDEDWIIEIEKGLVFIEKAIKEERQFIYSQGEVEPIEKVKHVSKDSVIHLAKHSNLITKEQTGEDIIPDQLYNVERLNDYAVYENRFLYMLLCYLKDFVSIRYEEILELTNKYDGKLSMKKEISLPKRNLIYSVELHDVKKDDNYLRENNSAKDVIDRIDLILKTVLAFLATPLMEFAGKAAKLKPPITKTNVLKMDNNFKGAVALYDFIVSYDKPGYEIECIKTNLSPFADVLADEISEAGALLSFLTYEYGLGLNAKLRESYELEERARREALIKEKNEQIEILKRRLAKNEVTPEEYILELEQQLKLLQNDNKQIIPLRRRVEELEQIEIELRARVSDLENECESLKNEIEEMKIRHEHEIQLLKEQYESRINKLILEHQEEIRLLNIKHAEEIAAIKFRYEEEIAALKAKHEEEIAAINAEHAEEIAKINEAHEAEINEINAQHEAVISALIEAHQHEIEALEERIHDIEVKCEEKVAAITQQMLEREAELQEEISEISKKLSDEALAMNNLAEEYELLKEEKYICEARIKALRIELGQLTDDEEFTDKEGFDNLEYEFKSFQKFYKNCWKHTKQKIRKDELNYQKLKGQKGQDKES